jgi:hypothetical protein
MPSNQTLDWLPSKLLSHALVQPPLRYKNNTELKVDAYDVDLITIGLTNVLYTKILLSKSQELP